MPGSNNLVLNCCLDRQLTQFWSRIHNSSAQHRDLCDPGLMQQSNLVKLTTPPKLHKRHLHIHIYAHRLTFWN